MVWLMLRCSLPAFTSGSVDRRDDHLDVVGASMRVGPAAIGHMQDLDPGPLRSLSSPAEPRQAYPRALGERADVVTPTAQWI